MKLESIVVIIDDSKTVQLVIRKHLRAIFAERNTRVEVLDAIDGQDALERITYWEKVDLILLDINMPRMDGFEFITVFRKLPNTQHVPIIIITTETSTEKMEKALSLGAADYFVKPFTLDDLRKVVDTHF